VYIATIGGSGDDEGDGWEVSEEEVSCLGEWKGVLDHGPTFSIVILSTPLLQRPLCSLWGYSRRGTGVSRGKMAQTVGMTGGCAGVHGGCGDCGGEGGNKEKGFAG